MSLICPQRVRDKKFQINNPMILKLASFGGKNSKNFDQNRADFWQKSAPRFAAFNRWRDKNKVLVNTTSVRMCILSNKAGSQEELAGIAPMFLAIIQSLQNPPTKINSVYFMQIQIRINYC